MGPTSAGPRPVWARPVSYTHLDVYKRQEFDNAELDDLVIFRADGYPTYNFAVVVDDLDMGITDVVRGDDHVNNTPRQINIYTALGAPCLLYTSRCV